MKLLQKSRNEFLSFFLSFFLLTKTVSVLRNSTYKFIHAHKYIFSFSLSLGESTQLYIILQIIKDIM